MQIKALGHIVLKVRNLERAAAFYRDILGMTEVMRYQGVMAFFSFSANHHDLGLLQLGDQAPLPDAHSTGLYHVAFKIGDTLDELRGVQGTSGAAWRTTDRHERSRRQPVALPRRSRRQRNRTVYRCRPGNLARPRRRSHDRTPAQALSSARQKTGKV
ncbi:MAG: hypothetical protein GC139_05310 [Sideroxydans sp.]|nr:hypothetical protein [Sideroxydans sp.]